MATSRVHNPGPPLLWVANGKGKNMATQKKTRRTSSGARSRRPNPARGTRGTKGSRSLTSLSRRAGYFGRRRRNPSPGMLGKGLALAAGAAVVQFTLGFIPPIGGVSPLADAARTAGVGYALSVLMQRTGFMSRFADDVALSGFTLAGGKLISSFILPFANRLFSPPAPPVPVDDAAGVNGIATWYPGQQMFPAYRGVNGLATWEPGQNPFPNYVPMA